MKLFSGFRYILRAVGRFNTFIILSIFYIAILGIAAFFVRLVGFFRKHETKAPLSYWQDKKVADIDKNSLAHQF